MQPITSTALVDHVEEDGLSAFRAAQKPATAPNTGRASSRTR
jgi:hypothetical protein